MSVAVAVAASVDVTVEVVTVVLVTMSNHTNRIITYNRQINTRESAAYFRPLLCCRVQPEG